MFHGLVSFVHGLVSFVFHVFTVAACLRCSWARRRVVRTRWCRQCQSSQLAPTGPHLVLRPPHLSPCLCRLRPHCDKTDRRLFRRRRLQVRTLRGSDAKVGSGRVLVIDVCNVSPLLSCCDCVQVTHPYFYPRVGLQLPGFEYIFSASVVREDRARHGSPVFQKGGGGSLENGVFVNFLFHSRRGCWCSCWCMAWSVPAGRVL